MITHHTRHLVQSTIPGSAGSALPQGFAVGQGFAVVPGQATVPGAVIYTTDGTADTTPLRCAHPCTQASRSG